MIRGGKRRGVPEWEWEWEWEWRQMAILLIYVGLNGDEEVGGTAIGLLD